MKLAVEILLVLTVFVSGSFVTWTVLALRSVARRERAEAERRLDETVARHPAGGTWRLMDPLNPLVDTPIRPGVDGFRPPRAEPKRAACGAWIGAEFDDYWTRQFAEIVHVDECATCRQETEQRRAA